MTTRNQSLDVLRGIAVLLVIVSHYPLYPWMQAGWFGVDLFFVLSGFLISGLLFRELEQTGTINLARFFVRRGFKIYPSFYVFVAFTAFAWPGMRSHLLGVSLFAQNYLQEIKSAPLRGWGHLWSLCVEEHFYLTLPFVLWALHYWKRLRTITGIAIALLVFCMVGRVVASLFGIEPVLVSWQTHWRIDGLFLGVALSYLFHFERERFDRMSSAWTLPLGLLLLVPMFAHSIIYTPLYSCVLLSNAVGFGAILCWAVTRKLRVSALELIGRHSYSIYLWHTICLVYFLRLPMSLTHFCENLAIALAIGIAMARLIEFPALRLRDKLQNGPMIRRIVTAVAWTSNAHSASTGQ